METQITSLIVVSVLFAQSPEAKLLLDISQGYSSEASIRNKSGYSSNPFSSQIITLSHFSLHFGIGIIL